MAVATCSTDSKSPASGNETLCESPQQGARHISAPWIEAVALILKVKVMI